MCVSHLLHFDPLESINFNLLVVVCYCTVVFRSQWFSLEPLCHFITMLTMTLSPSDPFNGSVQQELVPASGASGGDSAGVSRGGGAHLHPILRGVDALCWLLQ